MKTSIGSITVNPKVFATLVVNSALQIDGISNFTSSFVETLRDFFDNSSKRGVRIVLDGDDGIEIDLKLIFDYGCHIPKAALQARHAIVTEIESLTGYNVRALQINVVDLHVDKATLDVVRGRENVG